MTRDEFVVSITDIMNSLGEKDLSYLTATQVANFSFALANDDGAHIAFMQLVDYWRERKLKYPSLEK